MSRLSLPVVDPARTEFGFYRTHCDCPDCTRNCRHIPGYLVPADLERMHRHLGADQEMLAWAKHYLLASPGAIVRHGDRVFRIRTLVPARRPDGACTFLTEECRCAVHAVAPFGCGFFDTHMDGAEADRRSKRGLLAVLEAWLTGAAYARVWVALATEGLVAPAPEVVRRQLQANEGTHRL